MIVVISGGTRSGAAWQQCHYSDTTVTMQWPCSEYRDSDLDLDSERFGELVTEWHSWLLLTNCETWIMTLGVSDLQSDSDLDSIRNFCDVFLQWWQKEECWSTLALAVQSSSLQKWYMGSKSKQSVPIHFYDLLTNPITVREPFNGRKTGARQPKKGQGPLSGVNPNHPRK